MPKSERKKKIKQLLSGRKMDSGVLGLQNKQSSTKSPSGKYFQSIERLPLSLFINCLVDKTYHSLIIDGNPSQEELEAAFADLQQQYADKMGDTEYHHYNGVYKSLLIINCTIVQIEETIAALKIFPYVPLFDVLNKLLNTDFKFDYSKKEEYFKLLNRAYMRSRGLIIQRDLLQIKFDAAKEKLKGGGDKEITRAYFIDWLIALSNHAQMTITDQITVYEFCKRVKDYNQYVERQKVSNGRR